MMSILELARSRAGLLTSIAAAVAIFGASAAIPYWLLRDGDPVTVAQEPESARSTRTPAPGPWPDPEDRASTPAPGSSPNPAIPFWYVPYLNADREKPHFAGTLNGIAVDPEYRDRRTALDICPPDGLSHPAPDRYLATATEPGPMSIDPGRLPTGITADDVPWVWMCKDRLTSVSWEFSVKAGTPGANPGGGVLNIRRAADEPVVTYGSPAERWEAVTVAGRAGVLSLPIIEVEGAVLGNCFVAVFDEKSGVTTTVLGRALGRELCMTVAEVIFQ